MTMQQLEEQVFDLTRRVFRLEVQAGLVSRAHPSVSTPPAAPPVSPVPVTRPTAPGVPTIPPVDALGGLSGSTPVPAPTTPLVQPPAAGDLPPVAPAAKRPAGPSLEMRIGQNWMAWGGALFIVLAVGFFVKLAYDSGWLGRIPPIGKCAVAVAFGAALLGVGEWALRRIGRAAAVSLFSAGLGVLYLTAFATFKYFQLVSETGAFFLTALVAGLGFVITVRARVLVVGALSLAGGYLTPVLLVGASSFPGALPLYLTMLLLVGLGLSAWQERPFRAIRYVALVLQAMLGTAWLMHEGRSEWALALAFLVAWWLMATAEMVYAALRGQSIHGNATASLLSTIWFAAVGCWLLYREGEAETNVLGLFTLLLAFAAAGVAAAFGPGLSVLRAMPRMAMDRLAVSLWMQVGILLATAIGLHFDGPGIEGVGRTIGWLVMGLGCVELGRRLPSRGVTAFGLLVGSLGLLRLVLIDTGLSGLGMAVASVGPVTLTRWGLLALLAVGVTMAAAFRVQRPARARRFGLAAVLASIATLLWMMTCARQCTGLALTGGWVAFALGMLATRRWARLQRFVVIAPIVLVLCGVRWMVADAGGMRASPTWSAYSMAIVFNEQVLLAALIVAGAWWTARIHATETAAGGEGPGAVAREPGPWLWQAAFLAGAFVALVAMSFEVDRVLVQATVLSAAWDATHVRLIWWTLLWGAGGFGLWLGARSIGRAMGGAAAGDGAKGVHVGGWGLLALAAGVWLTIDTLGWRLAHGVTLAPVVFNAQFAVGGALGLMLAAAAWLRARAGRERGDARGDIRVAAGLGLATLIGLWLGSFEIDRAFAPEAGRVENAAMVRQTAWSIFWGLYAIGLIAIGFAKGTAWSRYAGLGLLAVTIAKVMIVDMAEVRYVYRVLSFLGLGVLLILTSVTYARLRGKVAEKGAG